MIASEECLAVFLCWHLVRACVTKCKILDQVVSASEVAQGRQKSNLMLGVKFLGAEHWVGGNLEFARLWNEQDPYLHKRVADESQRGRYLTTE